MLIRFVNDVTTKNANPLVFHFAGLMQMIHGGEHSVVTPGKFKFELGKMNRFFKGYRQHDAEEFVSYVLGRLSDETNRKEDLNTIQDGLISVNSPAKRKSDVFVTASEETEEEKLIKRAFAARTHHRKTANSFILDLFEGQYASQLKCKTCESTSTTFDPFLVLSLAIPTIAKADKSGVSLEDCFVNFATEEALSGSDQWYCSTCNVGIAAFFSLRY